MTRITLTLDPIEKTALLDLAEKEFRDPRAQATLIIRRELERLGLLQPTNHTLDTQYKAVNNPPIQEPQI